MDRLIYKEIAGTEYPLNFSVKAAKIVSDKYGEVSEIMTVLNEKNTADAMMELTWLLSVLIEQGVSYKKLAENEEVKGITEEELQVLMSGTDFIGLNELIMEAIMSGMTREVEVEDPKDPNEITTQG